MIKNILSTLMLLILSIPVTFAIVTDGKNLQIANSSKNNLFLKINNTCLKENYKIDAHSIKTISKNTILKECKKNLTSCTINVYLNKDCQNDLVALLTLDVTRLEIMKIAVCHDKYDVGANGPYLFVEGPWV